MDWDWVPVVFVIFKAVIFVTCMFFAIKWHYDQGKKKGAGTRGLIFSSVKIITAFMATAAAVLLLTLFLASRLGMDLSL